MKVNLGCGEKYLPGWTNCDVVKEVKADVYFDAEKFPYPLPSDAAEEILMDNVLEHLEDIPGVMNECFRILKPGGVLVVKVPYGKSDWMLMDPTHKHFFTEKTLTYFCIGDGFPRAGWYAKPQFILLKAELTTDNWSLRHKLRNLIPFRQQLRYFFFNLYDGLTFELKKPEKP